VKKITEEILARIEKQVGAKPCLDLSEWVETKEVNGKRIFDYGKLNGKYSFMVYNDGLEDKKAPPSGTLYYYENFWDAFFVGMWVFRDSGKSVWVQSQDSPEIRITIGRNNLAPDDRAKLA
jgi:hypothetical protein